MTRFSGEIGYGDPVETAPGVWEDVITEVLYQGDVIRAARNLNEGDKVNEDISLTNRISIVADDRAIKHFTKIKYVRWEGTLWTVTTAELQSPRLILSIGSVYNGPTPESP